MLEGSLSHLLPLRMSELWHQRNHISPQPGSPAALPAQVPPAPPRVLGLTARQGRVPPGAVISNLEERHFPASWVTLDRWALTPHHLQTAQLGGGDTARAEGQGELWGQTRSSSPVPAFVLELYKLPVLLPGNTPPRAESGCLDLFCMLSGETGDHWTSGQGQSHKNHKAVASNARPSASCSSWVPWGALQNSLRIHGLSHPMSSARRTWMGTLGRGWQLCPHHTLC